LLTFSAGPPKSQPDVLHDLIHIVPIQAVPPSHPAHKGCKPDHERLEGQRQLLGRCGRPFGLRGRRLGWDARRQIATGAAEAFRRGFPGRLSSQCMAENGMGG
jgi:hypothetical protein